MKWRVFLCVLAAGACGQDQDPASPGERSTPEDQRQLPECGDHEVCGFTCANLETDPNNCGQCGRSCVIANADAGCVAGECSVLSCEAGYFDNDGEIGNGCEYQDACTPNETCTTSCMSEGYIACDQGVATCEAPTESCNMADDDCNGECDEGQILGCRAGVHRAVGVGHLYTTDLVHASVGTFTLEAENYFYLYASEQADTLPLFLCQKPDGTHFLTTDTACESGATYVRDLGHLSSVPRCGSTALHRLYNPTNNDHFYTTSTIERDGAVTNYGYTSEFIAGYVWLAP